MNLTLDYLKSNRKWLVRNLLVWGNSEAVSVRMLMTEHAGTKRVMYSDESIGGKSQVISYDELVDSRGNRLPGEINNPVVMLIPRNSSHCYLVGQPSSNGFSVAREIPDHDTSQDGLVDLLIMEVDLP